MTASQYHPATLALQGLFALANETEREIARVMGLNLTDYRALSALAQSGSGDGGQARRGPGSHPGHHDRDREPDGGPRLRGTPPEHRGPAPASR